MVNMIRKEAPLVCDAQLANPDLLFRFMNVKKAAKRFSKKNGLPSLTGESIYDQA